MEKAEKVANEIARVLPLLQGDHIVPKNAYEKALCKQLNWEVFDNRYYDAFNGESYIEIKKGQSGMHFDMVRYAELLLGHGPADTLTVFFRWKKKEKRITEAYVIDTKVLIEFLRIDKRYALLYLQVKAQVPRGVNILASATAKDLRMISAFRIDSSGVHSACSMLQKNISQVVSKDIRYKYILGGDKEVGVCSMAVRAGAAHSP